jgi:eukaryotic-like serine/threonine-protein kinase
MSIEQNTQCADEETVDKFLVGGLPSEARPAFERHVDGCPRCQQLLVRRLERWSASRVSAPGSQPAGGQRYLILDEASALTGGSGRVLTAYDTLLDRKVALTFLAPPRAEQTVLAAVMREAIALARVAHPNLITVHDVGVQGGVPYLTMELVDGLPLPAWREQQRPGAGRVAQVMADAARGLAAAHAAGVVHRDVNPQTILVSDHRVVLTSFALSLPAAASATPMYPAPELLRGERADRRTDVFAFCATLYQMIHGQPPFAGTPRDELARLTELDEARLGQPPRSRAWSRLHRTAMPGLHPDPARRPTDLGRLADQLLTVPGARWRRPVLAAAAAAVLVAAFWGGGYLEANPERKCRAGAEAIAGSWNDGHRTQLGQRFRAAGVAAAGAWPALERMLDGYTSSWREMYGQTCAQGHGKGDQSGQVFDLRVACLEARRAGLEAFVGALGGASPLQMVRAPSAVLPDVGDCGITDRMGIKPLPLDPQARAQIAAVDKLVARAKAQQNLGEYRPADATAAQAVAQARQLGYEPLLASALIGHASVLIDIGTGGESAGEKRFDRTSALLEEAYNVAERGHDDRLRLAAAREQVLVQARGQNYPEGERWARLGQAMLARLGWPAEEGCRLSSHTGYLHRFQRRMKEAAADFQRAMDFAEKIPPAQRPRRLAITLTGFCSVKQDVADRIACARRSVEMCTSVFGPDHPDTAVAQAALAEALVRQPSTHAQACPIFAKVRASMDRTIEPTHPNAIAVLTQLAECLAVERQFPEARRMFEEVIARRPGPVDLGFAQDGLGQVLFLMGDLEPAIQNMRAALASLQSAFEPSNDNVMYSRDNLSDVLIHAGQTAEAQRVLQEGLDAARKAGEMTGQIADLRAAQGTALLAENRREAALQAFQDALRLHQGLKTADADLAYTLSGLGRTLLDLGRVDSARGHVERAFEARPESSAVNDELRADITLAMARVLLASGMDRRRACDLVQEASTAYRAVRNVAQKLQDAERLAARHRCGGRA